MSGAVIGRIGPQRQEVEIENLDDNTPGWAVLDGCECDSASLVAFFADDKKALAVDLLNRVDAQGERLVFDGTYMAAVLTSEGLFVANHCPDNESVAALAEKFGIDAAKWGVIA